MHATKPILTENRASHTPGPWRVFTERYVDSGLVLVDVVDAQVNTICEVNTESSGQSLDRHLANACVLAAAPDLLDVARRFQALYANTLDLIGPSVRALLNDLNAAIAKTEGVQ